MVTLQALQYVTPTYYYKALPDTVRLSIRLSIMATGIFIRIELNRLIDKILPNIIIRHSPNPNRY